jgi:hypothetical protein
MKTKLFTSAARLRCGISLASFCCAFFSVTFASPLRAADEAMLPGTVLASEPAKALTHDADADLKSEVAAMMKHMSNLMDKMSARMNAPRDPQKQESSRADDMAAMGRMLKSMGDMLSAVSAVTDVHGASEAKAGMCSCGGKMTNGMEKPESAGTAAKVSASKPEAPSGNSAPPATDHSAHH